MRLELFVMERMHSQWENRIVQGPRPLAGDAVI